MIQLSAKERDAACLYQVFTAVVPRQSTDAIYRAWRELQELYPFLSSVVDKDRLVPADLSLPIAVDDEDTHLYATSHLSPKEAQLYLHQLQEKTKLTFCVNHCVFDLFSQVVMFNQFFQLLQGQPTTPIPRSSMSEFALEVLPPAPFLEKDKFQFQQSSKQETLPNKSFSAIVGSAIRNKIVQKAKESNLKVYSLLAAVYIQALQKHSLKQVRNITLLCPFSQRNNLNTKNIGFLVEVLALDLEYRDAVLDLARQIDAQMQDTPLNSDKFAKLRAVNMLFGSCIFSYGSKDVALQIPAESIQFSSQIAFELEQLPMMSVFNVNDGMVFNADFEGPIHMSAAKAVVESMVEAVSQM